jgi:hypothetical protein
LRTGEVKPARKNEWESAIAARHAATSNSMQSTTDKRYHIMNIHHITYTSRKDSL